MIRLVTKDPAEPDFDAISWTGLIVVGLPLEYEVAGHITEQQRYSTCFLFFFETWSKTRDILRTSTDC